MARTAAFANNEPCEEGIPHIRVAATPKTPSFATPYSPFPTPQGVRKDLPHAAVNGSGAFYRADETTSEAEAGYRTGGAERE
jgi:hypothetical protein